MSDDATIGDAAADTIDEALDKVDEAVADIRAILEQAPLRELAADIRAVLEQAIAGLEAAVDDLRPEAETPATE